MNLLYAILAWVIIALGTVHMAATWRLFDALTPAALWFFNGGIVLVVSGGLNLVNRRHGAGASGLRWFCRGVNTVTLCFATVSGIVDGAGAASLVVVLGVMGGITLLSFVHRATPRTVV